MNPPITRPTMNPKIQLEAEADGSATSRAPSSAIGPSTTISGVTLGSAEGTSTSATVALVGRGVLRVMAGRLVAGGGVGAVVGAGVAVGAGVGSGSSVGGAVWHQSRFSPGIGSGLSMGSQ